jgi:hypothetical protein
MTHVEINGRVVSREKAYRATLLIPKKPTIPGDEKLLAEMFAVTDKLARHHWPDSLDEENQWVLPSGFILPLKDGDAPPEPGKSVIESNLGHWILRMETRRSIALVDGTMGPSGLSQIARPEKFYAGCYVRAYISPYPYDNINSGVSFGFSQIMKYAEGEPLGYGPPSPADTFNQYAPSQSEGSYSPETDGFSERSKSLA